MGNMLTTTPFKSQPVIRFIDWRAGYSDQNNNAQTMQSVLKNRDHKIR
jgi:hypothetical protein